jgi:hypothetical protein
MGTKRVGWARIRSLINENQNQLKTRNDQIKAVSSATTLTADDSGATIYWTHSTSNHDITLPAAKVGLNFKFVIAEGFAKNHHITCAGSDEVFGKVTVTSTTADKTDTQTEDKDTSNFTELRLHSSGNTLGGGSGDVIDMVCVEDGYWLVSAVLHTTGTAPAATVVMQA